MSPINVIPTICFHLNRVGNGNDDILPEKHFKNSKTRKFLFINRTVKYFNSIS
jgi:hypothetical protein